jgi:mannose-6-phosphate isomerase-like protein (cupin superfamily)
MPGYVTNIEKATIENTNFRKVLFTAQHCQLVVMSLKPSEDIGKEVHHVDQFIRIEEGDGDVVIGGKRSEIHADSAFVIPAGEEHNVTNSGKGAMKLYTLYSPPEHRDGTVHVTKADAERDEEDQPT